MSRTPSGKLQRGITLPVGIALFVGPNGSGKCRLLEAVAVATGCPYINGGEAAEVRSSSRVLARCLDIEQHGQQRFRGGLFVSHLGIARLGETPAQEHLARPGTLFLLDEPPVALSSWRADEFREWTAERVAEGCRIITIDTDAPGSPSLCIQCRSRDPKSVAIASPAPATCRNPLLAFVVRLQPGPSGRRLALVPDSASCCLCLRGLRGVLECLQQVSDLVGARPGRDGGDVGVEPVAAAERGDAGLAEQSAGRIAERC
ncbi:hypothetical protein ACFY1U_34125 [Streptomyces sp. NPDC001351]|uniref:hypothetical protein n=1 Tax=Streptomyces sp. NPDC001351 TaxID=3364564 RepID=UPI0036BC2B76